MSYSKKRIDYNNNYPDKIITFPGQLEFNNLLMGKGISSIFKPITLPLIEDFEFQRLLSFKIDIYEQLPQRPDIAFDLCWRTFEAYCTFFAKRLGWTTTKTYKILDKVCEDILQNQYPNNNNLLVAVNNLFDSIPLQATEFLVRRLFEDATGAIKSQQDKIIERVKGTIGIDLFNELETKYGNLSPDKQRRAGMLFQKLIAKEEIELNGKSFRLELLQVIKLLINGILYTYRNERFHGDSFSPFKSSRTQIKTYAHSFYCLFATYFFVSQLIYRHFPDQFNLGEIANQLEDNTRRYNLVFESYRKR